MKTFIKEMLLQFAAQNQENLETSCENHREYVILVPAIQVSSDNFTTQEQLLGKIRGFHFGAYLQNYLRRLHLL